MVEGGSGPSHRRQREALTLLQFGTFPGTSHISACLHLCTWVFHTGSRQIAQYHHESHFPGFRLPSEANVLQYPESFLNFLRTVILPFLTKLLVLSQPEKACNPKTASHYFLPCISSSLEMFRRRLLLPTPMSRNT